MLVVVVVLVLSEDLVGVVSIREVGSPWGALLAWACLVEKQDRKDKG